MTVNRVWSGLHPHSLTAGRTLGSDFSVAVGESSEIGPHRNAAEAGYVGTSSLAWIAARVVHPAAATLGAELPVTRQ